MEASPQPTVSTTSAIGRLLDDLFPLILHALGTQRVEDFRLRRQRLQRGQRIAVAGKSSRSSSDTFT
jgi:hypothetical protein